MAIFQVTEKKEIEQGLREISKNIEQGLREISKNIEQGLREISNNIEQGLREISLNPCSMGTTDLDCAISIEAVT